jgi:type IV pilus assembly protein PilV
MQNNQRRYRFLDTDKGFTLVEVLVAMGIFAIGILAIAQLQLWNVKNTTTGNITTMATMLARQQMETLKNEADVTTLSSDSDPNNPIDADGNPGGIFTRSWTVSNPLDSDTSRLLAVTVSWNRRGQTRSVVLTSITRGNGT